MIHANLGAAVEGQNPEIEESKENERNKAENSSQEHGPQPEGEYESPKRVDNVAQEE
jgi:hypothetical protein